MFVLFGVYFFEGEVGVCSCGFGLIVGVLVLGFGCDLLRSFVARNLPPKKTKKHVCHVITWLALGPMLKV